MKRIALFTLIILITNSLFAQNKAIEIHSGIQKNIYTLTEGNENLRSVPSIFLPQLGLNYYQSINENLSFKTGVTYYTYSCDIAQKITTFGEEIWTHGPYTAFEVISVPVCLSYTKYLGEHFALSLASGINLDFCFDPPVEQTICSGQSNADFIEIIYDNSLKRNFNVLLENRLSVSYATNYNLRFSLSGSYHNGLFPTWQSGAVLVYEHSETDCEMYDPQIMSRGSYWLIDFGIAYVFKKD